MTGLNGSEAAFERFAVFIPYPYFLSLSSPPLQPLNEIYCHIKKNIQWIIIKRIFFLPRWKDKSKKLGWLDYLEYNKKKKNSAFCDKRGGEEEEERVNESYGSKNY